MDKKDVSFVAEIEKNEKYVKKFNTYRHNDPANELVRCYETSRIRLNMDLIVALLKFAIIGGLISVVAISIGAALGGGAQIVIVLVLLVALLIWLFNILSDMGNQRKELDAKETQELEALEKE